MNTQEPHPKARPTLSEGQRRVLRAVTSGSRLVRTSNPFETDIKLILPNGDTTWPSMRVLRALLEKGYIEQEPHKGERWLHWYITPAGRAALHPDTDTDTDTGKQGRGGEVRK